MKNKNIRFARKIVFLIICFVLSASVYSFAENVDTTVAKTIAKNFYFEMASTKRSVDYSTLQLSLAQARVENTDTVYYVFNTNNTGWIIVSAINNVVPILAFSLEGTYSSANPPPAYVEWMNNYKDQILYVKQNNINADSSIANKWNKYSSIPTLTRNIQSVGPLLTSTWDQSPFYNDQCPGGSMTGCVATAMGQIMRYWGYDLGYYFPSQGLGSHSDANSNTITNYGTLTADFCSTSYDWANMPNALSASSSSAQKDAVATLLYHCGISVNMDYSPTGSGTQTSYVVDALKDHFGYSSTAFYYDKSNYETNIGDWQILLVNELDAGRPIEYKGVDYTPNPAAGHAFVCDGYQTTSYFHFNWGWGGTSNCYCYLSSLIPQGSTYNFSDDQGAVVGIQPGAYISLYNEFILTPNPIAQGQSLSVSVDLANLGYDDFNGDLFLGLFDQNTGALVETIQQLSSQSLTAQYYNTYNFYTSSVTSTPGNYILAVFYIKNGTTCWITAPENTYTNPLPVQVVAYQPLSANFIAGTTTICTGNSVSFIDQTSGSPTGWSWNFGDGNTSTLQNPSHTYNTAGTYTVSLAVTNATSSDSYSINNYIAVNALPTIAATPTGSVTLCQDAANTTYTTTGSTYATSYVWSISPASAGTISGTGTTATVNWNAAYTGTATIAVHGVNSCGNGTNSNSLSVTINSLPPLPTISANGNQLTSSAASGNQWYYNGSIITGATSQTYTATQNGTYTVVVTNGSGCSNTSAIYNYGAPLTQPYNPEVVATAGNYFVNGSYALEWTMGECIIETKTGTSNKLTQGFHQNSYVITLISETPNDNYSINVYPNPATDNVTVEIISKAVESFNLKLLDVQGKCVISNKLKSEDKTEIINLQKFATGLYMLNVYSDSGELLKTYKIQKIN